MSIAVDGPVATVRRVCLDKRDAFELRKPVLSSPYHSSIGIILPTRLEIIPQPGIGGSVDSVREKSARVSSFTLFADARTG